jgi:hypothetical protein
VIRVAAILWTAGVAAAGVASLAALDGPWFPMGLAFLGAMGLIAAWRLVRVKL